MREAIDYIDPFIGCVTELEDGDLLSVGKTFPGPATPFGLVQPGPDTTDKPDHTPGYNYYDAEILGFSMARMSGTGWYGEFGNFRMMPVTGSPGYLPNEISSRFSHKTESASVGYYRVLLERYGITAEITASARAGMFRFTYPGSAASFLHSTNPKIVIDLSRRIGGRSAKQYCRQIDSRTIEGWIDCPHRTGGWGRGEGRVSYRMHYRAAFSVPVTDLEFVEHGDVIKGKKEMEGEALRICAGFGGRRTVLVKVGVSFVDMEGARGNLEGELPHFSFERAYEDCRGLWRAAFDGIDLAGGTETRKESFFTALYHTMIDPRSASDLDGRYIGADGRIHNTGGEFVYRTIFSGWDVFRSQFPLQTIINPRMVNDEINTLIQLATLSGKGYLPRWENMNSYSGCMVGDPAVSVINDAYQKGIRNYDIEAAYSACRNTVLGPETNRDGAPDYLELGWVPGSISKTLENCYADWCLSRFATALGKTDDFTRLERMAANYKKIYDPGVGSMRARDRDGSWLPWSGKLVFGSSGEGNQGCIETNPFQQGWFVPHDVEGLRKLMGGDHFISELTELFEKTPAHMRWNDYYNHSNEPVHSLPFLFAAAGHPRLTEKWTRHIVDNAYGPGPEGLIGNEDVGQMSAWYVLAAMGFHPLCPGDNRYYFCGPLFQELSIKLDDQYYRGRTLRIIAENHHPDSTNVDAITLNGTSVDRSWISHDEVTGGGELKFRMS